MADLATRITSPETEFLGLRDRLRQVEYAATSFARIRRQKFADGIGHEALRRMRQLVARASTFEEALRLHSAAR